MAQLEAARGASLPVFIYALFCPTDCVVRYIGKSTDPRRRLNGHIASARRGVAMHHAARWIRKLLQQGLRPRLQILAEVQPGERWQDLEKRLIAEGEQRGWRLTNQTIGGDGVDYINPDDRAAASSKLAASKREAWADPEKRQRLLDGARAHDVLQRRAEVMTKRHRDPVFKAKHSTSLKRVSNTPEWIEMLKEIAARPEVKAAKAAANKAKTPEVRARQAATLRATLARKREAAQQSAEAA